MCAREVARERKKNKREIDINKCTVSLNVRE
jgi:hypothetical protein